MARPAKKWSQEVTEHSDALDLEPAVFKSKSPKRIADSLKHSAETSHRRKSGPFRSAMSMLVFYINRAGRHLPGRQKHVLEEAKDELRKDFGREPAGEVKAHPAKGRAQPKPRGTAAKRPAKPKAKAAKSKVAGKPRATRSHPAHTSAKPQPGGAGSHASH